MLFIFKYHDYKKYIEHSKLFLHFYFQLTLTIHKFYTYFMGSETSQVNKVFAYKITVMLDTNRNTEYRIK